jgi:phosphoribosylaminoimidazole-succinocarboxamide synthase
MMEGKTKILSPLAPDAQGNARFQVVFKDDATAFNGVKHEVISGKGAINADISARLFTLLGDAGLPTCFLGRGDAPNVLHYLALTMVPIEVVVRNVAYGSLCKRYGLEAGMPLRPPVVEFFVKSDALGDPAIPPAVIEALGYLPEGVRLESLTHMALAANEVLSAFFANCGIVCADFKLEMGLDASGQLRLGDELSPDSFRLRDACTGQVLDKDVFRFDLADLKQTYESLHQRLCQVGLAPLAMAPVQYQARVWVRSRQNILNPESKTILEALHTLGYSEVSQLQAGKRFDISLNAPNRLAAAARLEELAKAVLSNPVIEDVSWDIVAASPQAAEDGTLSDKAQALPTVATVV